MTKFKNKAAIPVFMGYAGLMITHFDLLSIINDNTRGKNTPMQSQMFDIPRYGKNNGPYFPDYGFPEEPRQLLGSNSVSSRRLDDGDIYAHAKYARAGHIKSALSAGYSKAKTEIKHAVAKVYNSGKRFFRNDVKHGEARLEQILEAT